MSKATFGQALQTLNLVHSKGVDLEQLEKLFESGLLSDILDADLSGIKRNDFREFIGLHKIGFRFCVNYSRPLAKLLEHSNLKGIDHRIVRENIPFQNVGKSKKWVMGELHTFVRNGIILGLDTKDGELEDQKYCMKKLQERGVRGATIEELIAFHMAFPNEDKNRKKIFAPGSPVNIVSGASWHIGEKSGNFNSMVCLNDANLDLADESAWTSYYMLAIRS